MRFLNHNILMSLDYKEFEEDFGDMYHLVIDRINTDDGVRFVHDGDGGRYASIDGAPVFFGEDQEFHVALEYTIIYPKIYILDSEHMKMGDLKFMGRSIIQ